MTQTHSSTIQSVQSTNAVIKRLETENKKLKAENAEGGRHIEELRKIIFEFDTELGKARAEFANVSQLRAELRQAQEAAASLQRETEILTRALALQSVDSSVDGENAISSASMQWDLDALRNEVERLRHVDQAWQQLREENDDLVGRLSQFQKLHAELLTVKSDRDVLERKNFDLVSQLRMANSEVTPLMDKVTELETRLRIAYVGKTEADEQIQILSKRNEAAKSELGDLSREESLQKQKLVRLEQAQQEHAAKNADYVNQIEALKSAMSSKECEIKRLTVSLEAESEANGSLSARLARVESELNQLREENASLKLLKEELDSAAARHSEVASQRDRLLREATEIRAQIEAKDEKIAQLVSVRDVQKKALGSEIQRLSHQLEMASSRANELSQKHDRIAREKEKIKSLLAKDTMGRLGKLLSDPNHRYSPPVSGVNHSTITSFSASAYN